MSLDIVARDRHTEEEEKQESKRWGGIVSQTGGGELSGNSQGELPKNRRRNFGVLSPAFDQLKTTVG